jgi:hypothetical protein
MAAKGRRFFLLAFGPPLASLKGSDAVGQGVTDFHYRWRGASSARLRTRSPVRSCWAHRGHSHVPLALRRSQPAAIASIKLSKSEPQLNQAVSCPPWCAALSQASSTASRAPILIVLEPTNASPCRSDVRHAGHGDGPGGHLGCKQTI